MRGQARRIVEWSRRHDLSPDQWLAAVSAVLNVANLWSWHNPQVIYDMAKQSVERPLPPPEAVLPSRPWLSERLEVSDKKAGSSPSTVDP
jgi:hypothetical protein